VPREGHPFGMLIDMHLKRKPGLSKAWLARAIDVDPSVISHMCRGQRLTDRGRILQIVQAFYDAGALECEEEATALLEAAGLCRLRPENGLDYPAGGVPLPPGEKGERDASRPRHGWWLPATAAAVLLAVIGYVASFNPFRGLGGSKVIWQATFDPVQQTQWAQVSARWEDVPGSGAMLVEDNPDEGFGKVESNVVLVEGERAVLLVDVSAVDPGASYSVQLLDKQTGAAVDVLREVVCPGEHSVQVADVMGWQAGDSHLFTINVWIGGEGQAVTFECIAVVER
jgi:hypothetical protein